MGEVEKRKRTRQSTSHIRKEEIMTDNDRIRAEYAAIMKAVAPKAEKKAEPKPEKTEEPAKKPAKKAAKK